jgi:hypothetical protein
MYFLFVEGIKLSLLESMDESDFDELTAVILGFKRMREVILKKNKKLKKYKKYIIIYLLSYVRIRKEVRVQLPQGERLLEILEHLHWELQSIYPLLC